MRRIPVPSNRIGADGKCRFWDAEERKYITRSAVDASEILGAQPDRFQLDAPLGEASDASEVTDWDNTDLNLLDLQKIAQDAGCSNAGTLKRSEVIEWLKIHGINKAGDKADPARLAETEAEFTNRAREIIEKHRGTPDDQIGNMIRDLKSHHPGFLGMSGEQQYALLDRLTGTSSSPEG